MPLLEEGVARARALCILSRQSLRHTWLAEAYLLAGRADEARTTAHEALRLARAHEEKAYEGGAPDARRGSSPTPRPPKSTIAERSRGPRVRHAPARALSHLGLASLARRDEGSRGQPPCSPSRSACSASSTCATGWSAPRPSSRGSADRHAKRSDPPDRHRRAVRASTRLLVQHDPADAEAIRDAVLPSSDDAYQYPIHGYNHGGAAETGQTLIAGAFAENAGNYPLGKGKLFKHAFTPP